MSLGSHHVAPQGMTSQAKPVVGMLSPSGGISCSFTPVQVIILGIMENPITPSQMLIPNRVADPVVTLNQCVSAVKDLRKTRPEELYY